MKKILLITIMALLLITGCTKKNTVKEPTNVEKETIKEEINWYIDFGNNARYIMCENQDKYKGKCYIGRYAIISGKLETSASVTLLPEYLYENGKFHGIFDADIDTYQFERYTQYKKSIVSLATNKDLVFIITLVDEVKDEIK